MVTGPGLTGRVVAGPVLTGPVLTGPPDGSHDVLVAGAPADLPGQRLTDLRGRWIRVVVQQPPGGEHHARRAEAALEPVTLRETLLDRVEHATALQALHREYPVPIRHGREHSAGFHRCVVQPHDA